jgi:hypothetical protein
MDIKALQMMDMADLGPLILQPVESVITRVYCIPMREKRKRHMNHIVMLAVASWRGESREPHSSFQKPTYYRGEKKKFFGLETIFCVLFSNQRMRIMTKIGVELYIPCFLSSASTSMKEAVEKRSRTKWKWI